MSSIFVSVGLYLYHSLTKQLQKIWVYIFFFIALIAVQSAFADEYDEFSEYMEDICTQNIFDGQLHSEDQQKNNHHKSIAYYEKKSLEHGKKGREYWKKAHDLKILFPCVDNRERAKDFLAAGVATSMTPGNPMSKMIAGIIILATQQMRYVLEEWDKFFHYLHKSEHHFALAEFYSEVCVEYKKENKKISREEKDYVYIAPSPSPNPVKNMPQRPIKG